MPRKKPFHTLNPPLARFRDGRIMTYGSMGGDGQPQFQAADNSPRVNPDYVLGTGDKIHLSVFDEADLSGDYTVDGSGYVRLPLIGQIRAAGH